MIKSAVVFVLMGCGIAGCNNAPKDNPMEIREIARFHNGRCFIGYVFEYEGKKYILNHEGGIHEIKQCRDSRSGGDGDGRV